MEKVNTIGKEFTTIELIKFATPPILAQFAMSLLSTLDDGLFLSRYVGTTALAAFSIAFPVFMFFMALVELFNGSSVLCSTKMGEGKLEEARKIFTSTVITAGIFGCFVSILGRVFLDQIIVFLGGTEILFPYVKAFLEVGVWYIPLILVNRIFGRFYVPAGNSRMSLYTTLLNAFCNFFFDWVFIVRMRIGMAGGAYANLISHIFLFIVGITFYSRKNSEIRFSKPDTNSFAALIPSAKLGFPPFLTNVAISVNSFIANQVLLHVGGEESVSAYTIINNIQFMFMGGVWGLTGAVSPIVSYAYGEKNGAKIKKTIRQIIKLTTGLIGLIVILYYLGRNPLLKLYLKSDASDAVRQMAGHGLMIAPLGFLFFGYNILGIDTSIALHEKKISTALSVLENVICANLTMLTLPFLFGVPGVWFAFPVGEILTFGGTIFFTLRYLKQYF